MGRRRRRQWARHFVSSTSMIRKKSGKIIVNKTHYYKLEQQNLWKYSSYMILYVKTMVLPKGDFHPTHLNARHRPWQAYQNGSSCFYSLHLARDLTERGLGERYMVKCVIFKDLSISPCCWTLRNDYRCRKWSVVWLEVAASVHFRSRRCEVGIEQGRGGVWFRLIWSKWRHRGGGIQLH
jgi:hypothetical protein